MARMGMDVDQVASAGKALKQRAVEIDALVSKLDGIVRGMPGVWDGPDAQQFVNEWWPEHKKTLVAASQHVAGLGQSALNNASEQRDVSGSNGTGGGTNGGGSTETPVAPGGSGTGTPVGGVNGPSPSQEAYNSRPGGPYGPGGPYDGQCTSWVDFRRRELGLPAPAGGNGAETAFRLSGTSPIPSAGAVGSFNEPGQPWGHTFVVEGITADNPRTITVSEMNVGKMVDPNNAITEGWGEVSSDTYTEVAPGQWKSSRWGFVRAVTFGQ